MNYAQISERVADWINRGDLSARIPDFIELAEERMNRALRVRQMESPLAATAITDNLITPAADVIDVKVLWVPDYERTPLKPQALESVIAGGYQGTPTMYAWDGADLRFDGAGDVQGVLYVRIPALSTATTNWVSEGPWSLYLWGALMEASLFVKNAADATTWEGRFQQVLDELRGNDQRRSGPMVARAR
ncbi:phage adaptor protein [Pseudomonas sp.]|uniref:phage adaptor protein n=1 Tax=Pseudomonas sp. TaxID=306 RepID=UPI003F30FF39